MIGTEYQSAAIQAVIGPAHSTLIPAVLWSGWLDASLAVLSMTGLTIEHDDFGEVAGGVANTIEIDGGLCPATVPAFFGLFDAETDGELVAYAAVTFDTAPAEDEPLMLLVGALTFVYDDGAA